MNDAVQRALPIPPAIAEAAELAPEAHELIRAWWDGQQTRMMIRTTFDNPAHVGILLSELAWHFANGYAGRLGRDRSEILEDIRERWTQQQAVFDKNDLVLPTDAVDQGAARS